MGKLYDDFRTDPELEKNGVVLDYGEYWVRIARAGGANKAYQVALDRKLRPYRRALQNDALSVERQNDLVRETYIETVILEWGGSGMVDEKNSPLEFTQGNVRKVLTDLPDLWLDILGQAQKAILFRKEILEAEAKNS